MTSLSYKLDTRLYHCQHGQLQPHSKSKAWQLSTQLNTRNCDIIKLGFRIMFPFLNLSQGEQELKNSYTCVCKLLVDRTNHFFNLFSKLH